MRIKTTKGATTLGGGGMNHGLPTARQVFSLPGRMGKYLGGNSNGNGRTAPPLFNHLLLTSRVETAAGQGTGRSPGGDTPTHTQVHRRRPTGLWAVTEKNRIEH